MKKILCIIIVFIIFSMSTINVFGFDNQQVKMIKLEGKYLISIDIFKYFNAKIEYLNNEEYSIKNLKNIIILHKNNNIADINGKKSKWMLLYP